MTSTQIEKLKDMDPQVAAAIVQADAIESAVGWVALAVIVIAIYYFTNRDR